MPLVKHDYELGDQSPPRGRPRMKKGYGLNEGQALDLKIIAMALLLVSQLQAVVSAYIYYYFRSFPGCFWIGLGGITTASMLFFRSRAGRVHFSEIVGLMLTSLLTTIASAYFTFLLGSALLSLDRVTKCSLNAAKCCICVGSDDNIEYMIYGPSDRTCSKIPGTYVMAWFTFAATALVACFSLMLYPEDVATITEFFDALDENKDGKLSVAEIRQACAVDIDGNGTIDGNEIVIGAAPWLKDFASQDLDADQLVSLDELLQYNNKQRTI